MDRERAIRIRPPFSSDWSLISQRRENRRLSRSIFKWSLVSLIFVITFLSLFLLGTIAAASGEVKSKWQMYIAGNVVLLLAVVPVSCLGCSLFRYKCAQSTGRFLPVQTQEHETLFPDRGRSDSNECQPGSFANIPGDRHILQTCADDLDSSATVAGSPPSYESATCVQNDQFSLTALAYSSRI